MRNLTVGQRALLEADLQQRQRQLGRRLNEHHGGLSRAEHAREVLLQDGDDAPQREGERELDMALSDLETLELAAVKEALARLHDGRYGTCADCDADIPFDRLKAEPWALRCVACETTAEAAGKRRTIQPLADGFKLLVKETIIPSNSNKFIFILSPILTFTLSLIGWAVIPYDEYAIFAQINLGVLYLFAVSSLGVYGVIMSGWSSNSKYAFLGSLRSAAQMVSYEVTIGFIILNVAVCTGSFDLQEVIESQRDVWFVFLFSPLAIIFFVCSLAETNRHPFDLPEAEAELVSGYNVEYSAMGFALFSLGEYCHMLLMSALNVTLFFGGWLPPFKILGFIPGSFWFGLKIGFFVILFIVVRAALPRYRYDQLMGLGWKVFLPISIAYLMVTVSIVECFNMTPY